MSDPKPAFDVEAKARGVCAGHRILGREPRTHECQCAEIRAALTESYQAGYADRPAHDREARKAELTEAFAAGVATRISPEDYIAAIKETQREAALARDRQWSNVIGAQDTLHPENVGEIMVNIAFLRAGAETKAREQGKREANAAWMANEDNQNADIDGSYHCACAVDESGKSLQECMAHRDQIRAAKREGRVEGMKECEAELHQKVATVGPSAFLQAFKVVAALVAKEESRG